MNTDLLSLDPFVALLRRFNKLVEQTPSKDKIKSGLASIKEDALNNHEINGRQREAIVERVANYENGTYGSTSRTHQVGSVK